MRVYAQYKHETQFNDTVAWILLIPRFHCSVVRLSYLCMSVVFVIVVMMRVGVVKPKGGSCQFIFVQMLYDVRSLYIRGVTHHRI